MKKLTGILLGLSLIASASANAEAVKCKATTKGTNWKEASVRLLKDSAQMSYVVSATGIFATADLLCAFTTGECVGFIGGAYKIEGKLQFDDNGPRRPISVSFHTDGSADVPQLDNVEFSCI